MQKIIVQEKNGYLVFHYPNPKNDFDLESFKSLIGVDANDNSLLVYDSPADCPFITDDGKTFTKDPASLYIEEGNLKSDDSWNRQVMTPRILKNEALSKKRKLLSDELAKQNPDIVVVTKLQFEIEFVRKKSLDDAEYWAQFALDGLDKRVLDGKADKPIVRQKIEAKLQQIQDEKEGSNE